MGHFEKMAILKTAHDSAMQPAMDEQPIYHSLLIKTEN